MVTQYFLGCSGFYYNHWKSKFYPEKLSKTRWLEYYARFFNTLEVNNTFYRYPSQKLLEGWYLKTADNFTFAVKANRIITHLHKFKGTEQYTANFYKLAHLLRQKLLCVLFQLPPMVHKNMDLLQTIASQLDPSVMNVLEFRHESWWDSEVYDFMDKRGIVFCSVSASELPKRSSKLDLRFMCGFMEKTAGTSITIQTRNLKSGRSGLSSRTHRKCYATLTTTSMQMPQETA